MKIVVFWKPFRLAFGIWKWSSSRQYSACKWCQACWTQKSGECNVVECNVCIVLLFVALLDYSYWCIPHSGVYFIYLLYTYCVLWNIEVCTFLHYFYCILYMIYVCICMFYVSCRLCIVGIVFLNIRHNILIEL